MKNKKKLLKMVDEIEKGLESEVGKATIPLARRKQMVRDLVQTLSRLYGVAKRLDGEFLNDTNDRMLVATGRSISRAYDQAKKINVDRERDLE